MMNAGATKGRPRPVPRLMLAQFQVAFNDNAVKMLLLALSQYPGILPPGQVTLVVSVVTVLLVLPFITFSPLCGWLADRYPKTAVIRISLLMQVGAVGFIIAMLFLHLLWMALGAFFLLACQAVVFSPAKRGILKELVGSERLSVAVGWMEMLTVGAILIGAFAGGKIFDIMAGASGDPWRAATEGCIMMLALSVLSWVLFCPVPETEAKVDESYRASLWWEHFNHVRELWNHRPLFRSALGIVWFYLLGGIVYMTLLQAGRELHGGDVGSASSTSTMLLLLGVGTIAGNLSAGFLSRPGIQLGLVPIGLGGMAVSLALAGGESLGSAGFLAWLTLSGFFSGLFLVPLFAFLQDRASEERRGRVLGAVNVMDSIGGVAASGIYYLLADSVGLSARGQMLVLSIMTTLVGIYTLRLLPDSLLRLLGRWFVRIFYRVKVEGMENLPAGGVLIVCNHVSYVDPVILQAVLPRPARFVGYSGLAENWVMRRIFKVFGVIPIAPLRATEGVRRAAEHLVMGGIVVIFPEGSISRTGALMGLRGGYEVIARKASVPVVPVVLDSLWGSIFSFWRGRYFWKMPRRLPFPVNVAVGRPLDPWRTSPVQLRREMCDLGERAFQMRGGLEAHVGRAAVGGLASRPWRVVMIDRTAGRRVLRAGPLLATASLLAERIRAEVPGRRVGIVLPPGAGGLLANLAVALAGRVPVNFNFTAGRATVEKCLRMGGIDTVITAAPVIQKLPAFPWTERTMDLAEAVAGIGRGRILARLAGVWLLPRAWLADRHGLPRTGGAEEAGLLFTSGSSGEPKGVVLTHRNIISNIEQIHALDLLRRGETLLACLPLFHSMGFTITIWYPFRERLRLVGLPSPLDTRRVVDAIDSEKVTILLSTATFLRPMLKKADPEQLRSLKVVATGAEKLPDELLEAFREKFGITILQGYGLTETTPVTNVNLPDSPAAGGWGTFQVAGRIGSVGRMVPGLTARIRHPETGEHLPLTQPGVVCFKGPNVFGGYLDDPERTAEAIVDGWFVTGDIGRFDEDGFLHIEGRLSRFSKIGGEMVPHGTIEQKVAAIYNWDSAEGQAGVIVGIPDAAKGEALALVTTCDVTAADLREKLVAAGLPNLWIPKVVARVDKLPVLGSGKCDLNACRVLAEKASAGQTP